MKIRNLNKWGVIGIVVLLFLAGLLFAGAKKGAIFVNSKIETPTSTPTTVIVLTRTPTYTSTPTRTSSPPTKTIAPTLIPTSSLLDEGVLSFWNEFDNTDPIRGDWRLPSGVIVNDSLMIIQGSDDWTGVYGNLQLVDGETILIQFRFEDSSSIHIVLETGEWETESYKSWGINVVQNYFTPTVSEGTLTRSVWFSGTLEPSPDHWYVLMMHIGEEGSFLTRLWDYDDPSLYLESQQDMGEYWKDHIWVLVIAVGPGGIVEVTRFEELMP